MRRAGRPRTTRSSAPAGAVSAKGIVAVAVLSIASLACDAPVRVADDLGSCTLVPLDPGGAPLAPPYRVRMSAVGGDRVAFVDVAGTGWRDARATTIAPDGRTESADVDDATEIVLSLPAAGDWVLRVEDAAAGCVKEIGIEVVPG